MPVLTPAETRDMVDLLLQDINAANWATLLERRAKSPAQYTESPHLREQLEATFAGAEQEGWMAELLVAIAAQVGEGLPSSDHALELVYQYRGGNGLQTLLTGSNLYEPALVADQTLFVTGHVCLLEIKGNPAGTGLLIGPDQVLTAFHVVAPLVEAGKQKDGCAHDLRCRFDFVIRRNAAAVPEVRDGVRMAVAQAWLGAFSPQHPAELEHKPPPDGEGGDMLDYAIVILAQPVGTQAGPSGAVRGWTALRKPTKALRRFSWIRVIQHPSGAPQKAADGHVTAFAAGAPRLRYYVSTALGSSGGPCWNFDFDLVAMHNFGGVPAGNGKENQGIPIAPIIDHLVKGRHTIPVPYVPLAGNGENGNGGANGPGGPIIVTREKPVWSVGTDYPVLDRVSFQGTLRQMTAADGAQILRVRGQRYSGRSFSLRIAQRLLGKTGHTVVPLSAIAMSSMTPESFIVELSAWVDLTPVPLPPGAELSTRTSLAHRHLLTGLLGQLRKKFPVTEDEPRLLWLFVDCLDQAALPQEMHDLLIALAQRVSEAPALRLVLIGYEQELPSEVDALLLEESIGSINANDINRYLRYVSERIDRPLLPDDSRAMAEAILANASTDPALRLKGIAEQVRVLGQALQSMGAQDHA